MKPRWIVSARYDLVFFIGSCFLTFAFYGLYRSAHNFGFLLHGDSILITYFFFTALFDHPHIFQTFARTHADKDEFQKRRGLYTWGLAGFIAIGFVFVALRLEAYLIVGAAVYGTWHIMRQHYGFLKIYKALNDDRAPLDNWLDGLTYFTGMFACFFNDYGDVRGPLVVYGSVQVSVPNLPGEWGEGLWIVFLLLLTLFGFRQVGRAMLGQRVNVPKILLMLSALGTHYFVFFVTATPFLVAEALETAYHDVQYHAWMAHYEKRRFPGVRNVASKWGATALAYGCLVGVIEIKGLLQPESWAMWAFIPFTMVVIFHYFVDGLVWKMSDYPELGKLLLQKPKISVTKVSTEASE